MSAVEALKAARAAGISVRIDGDDVVLEAAAPPPPAVNDTLPAAPATQYSQETFEFAPPGDPANDDEGLQERVAIMMESNGWDEATALREARWDADRQRCWRAFLRNAQRVLDAPEEHREGLLGQYQAEAIRRYGERTGTDMATSLRNQVAVRRLH